MYKKHLLIICLFATGFSVSFSANAQQQNVETVETPEFIEVEREERHYSSAEIKILQELEKKHVELERREKAIELRERLVDLAEQRLAEKADKLDMLKTEIEGLLTNLSDKEEEELTALTKIYEAMKPAAAASVMNRMDNKIVFDVFKRMGRKSTAKIMEKMATGKARVISEMLAEKSDLPPFN